MDGSTHRVPILVAGAHAAERRPCSHVVPTEIARQHQHFVAALQHADIHGYRRRDRAKEPVKIIAKPREMRRNLWRMRRDLIEKVAGAPDENSRIPEKSVAHHRLGALTIRLLDEPRDAADARAHLVARLDVPESWIGAHRHDTHRDERPVLRGGIRRTRERGAESFRITHGPIGVEAQHHRVATAAARDLVRRPRERRGGAGRTRFGNEIGPRNRRREFDDGVNQPSVRENQRPLGRHRRREPR